MRLASLIVLALLTAPAAAQADLVVPDELVPGQEVVVDAGKEPGLAGGEVRLTATVSDTAFGRVVVGKIVMEGDRAIARFRMPAAFACVSGCEGERRFFPGLAVRVSVCSPYDDDASTYCVGRDTTAGGRVRVVLNGRVKPRRAG